VGDGSRGLCCKDPVQGQAEPGEAAVQVVRAFQNILGTKHAYTQCSISCHTTTK
jgi:hypothetical protein